MRRCMSLSLKKNYVVTLYVNGHVKCEKYEINLGENARKLTRGWAKQGLGFWELAPHCSGFWILT